MYIVLGIVAVFGYYIIKINKTKKKLYHIAILQDACHPSLDEARNGFIEEIYKEYGADQIQISYFNGEGSIANIYALTNQLINNNDIDMFYTIASHSTQNIYKAEKNRPLIFAAVSDPLDIGIEKNNSRVCGICDSVPEAIPLLMINQLLPQAKKIGLISSTATLNNNEIKKISLFLEQNNKVIIPIIINNEQEINSLLDTYIPKIDILLSLCDNTVAATVPMIVKKTTTHNIPFIACFGNAVQNGALAAYGNDYYENGKRAASFANSIIKKEKKPHDIGITYNKNEIIYVNKKSAEKLNLSIPKNTNIVII